jgi:hypothetical protein
LIFFFAIKAVSSQNYEFLQDLINLWFEKFHDAHHSNGAIETINDEQNVFVKKIKANLKDFLTTGARLALHIHPESDDITASSRSRRSTIKDIQQKNKHGCSRCINSHTCLFKPNWNNEQHDLSKNFLNVLIVENPKLSSQIFDTFVHTDVLENESHAYLDHLEPCEDLSQYSDKYVRPFSPLETIYIYDKKELCTHPVVETLISVKLRNYAKLPILMDVFKQLCLTVVWTIFACCEDYSIRHWYHNGNSIIWKVFLLVLCIIFFLWDIFDELSTVYFLYKRMKGQEMWLQRELIKQQDSIDNGTNRRYLLIRKVKKLNIDINGPLQFKNLRNFIPLALGIATLVSHFVDIVHHTDNNARTHIIIACLNVVMIWYETVLNPQTLNKLQKQSIQLCNELKWYLK